MNLLKDLSLFEFILSPVLQLRLLEAYHGRLDQLEL